MTTLTAAEQASLYGATAAEWLQRWDAGQLVWTIEMGGLGPGYEQCIHITCAEVLRHVLAAKYDPTTWEDDAVWQRDLEAINAAVGSLPEIRELDITGAQWGAAVSLALHLYRHGPVGVLTDKRIADDRHIQVQRAFPFRRS